MTPEQILFYSDNCFGTADAIAFRGDLLRIHDLKTGAIPAHMEQLEVYAALFCLEYKIKPADIRMELRLYLVLAWFMRASEFSLRRERTEESFANPIFSAISLRLYPFSLSPLAVAT